MRGRAVRKDSLGRAERAAMFGLLERHFSGVAKDVFARDLDDKNWVILLEGAAGDLVGFSTLLCYETELGGRLRRVVYSGDTIVAPAAWGSFALPRTWIQTVTQLHAGPSRDPLLWLLITSGFRTYRFLPVFFACFWPRHEAATPEGTQALIDSLAAERFGRRYDPARGIVRFERPQALREALAEIPSGKLCDPHVAYFARRNPGHSRGDELVCLAELSRENMTRAGQRMADGGRAAAAAAQ
ncbi:MAG TPA: hypothetical protein VMR50_04120 [Myxococcota bacterium]|nr:hypothetical protein [Myxococcota bacterium]